MIWRKSFIVLFLSLFQLPCQSQTYNLSSELKEISGLELIADSILVAVNDGGNSAHLFLLNQKGKIMKKVLISNASNVDWEDIAADNEFIYIADIGNNLNKRKDLRIYRVRIKELLELETVKADEMLISYSDQNAFPPTKARQNFDSECLISAYGDLWIFSKNNSDPFDGYTQIYRFNFSKDTSLNMPVFSKIYFGNRGYYFDTPTAGDFQNGRFYLSTYNRWVILELKGNEFVLLKKKKFAEYNQKEALTINGSLIWVANEYNKLSGGPKLKRIKLK
jgi:hypothetical protein